jgi:hypothetical protein
VRTLTWLVGRVRGIAFARDGLTFFSGSLEGNVEQWRSQDGALLGSLEGDAGPVQALAYAPDGRLLASGSSDGYVRVWRTSDGRLAQVLFNQAGAISDVAYSPDGSLIASSAQDGMIRVWESSTGALFASFQAGTRGLWSLAFSPDGRTLCAGGWEQIYIISFLRRSAEGDRSRARSGVRTRLQPQAGDARLECGANRARVGGVRLVIRLALYGHAAHSQPGVLGGTTLTRCLGRRHQAWDTRLPIVNTLRGAGSDPASFSPDGRVAAAVDGYLCDYGSSERAGVGN